MTTSSFSSLQTTWRTLYSQTLPQLARAKDPAQSKWPVTLDHCFARIILDNTIGKGATSDGGDTKWDNVITKPAIANMSETQLRRAVELGEEIKTGAVDLVELDEASLRARGKESKTQKKAKADAKGKKRKAEEDNTAPAQQQRSPKKLRKQDDGKTQSIISFAPSQNDKATEGEPKQLPSPTPETGPMKVNYPVDPSPEFFRTTLRHIVSSDITPFRKRLYTALLSVPRGEYTTYAALADFLGSAARAVGNGMRNNSFAPDVPCHRVLASDRTIGGFMGSWTKKGEKANDRITRKIGMLKEEGVRFDSVGRVKSPIWRGFKDLKAFEVELGEIA